MKLFVANGLALSRLTLASLTIAVTAFFGGVAGADNAASSQAPGGMDKMLGVKGTTLCNHQGKGDEVRLRGVNVGGWLEWQNWMTPIDSSKTLRGANPGENGFDFNVRHLLEKRFGTAVEEDLINTYQDAWITTQDLDNIKALNMNVVRLTISYDSLLHDDGTWRDDAFKRVDWFVKNAWDRGIYTIIDYHAFLPPGANQDGSALGYWGNSAEQDETVRIWTKMAAHFKGNPAVAMYDLLNEPNNSSPHGRAVPSHETICALYDRLYHAIRAVDPDHVITMEGLWGWKALRDPRAVGYTNVAYSFHWYHTAAKTTAAQYAATDKDLADIAQMQALWHIPCFVSEFSFSQDAAAWKYGLRAFDKAGLNWAPWAYKDKASGDSYRGIYTTIPGKIPPVPNLVTDSAEEIRTKWKAWTTENAFQLNPMFRATLAEEQNDPWTPRHD